MEVVKMQKGKDALYLDGYRAMNCGLTELTEEGRVLQNPGKLLLTSSREHTHAPNDVS
ncbi:unnamed protein product, partial [Ixodes hexagonus]